MNEDVYLGEIRLFAGSQAPTGWAFCHGQLLQISSHEPLFVLLGTIYGGDGQSTFALPNLQGRIPVHVGPATSYASVVGSWLGEEQVTLITNHLPGHTHLLHGSSQAGDQSAPSGNFLAASALQNGGYADSSNTTLATPAMLATGGAQPHDNLQPYLCLNYIICIEGGVFPVQT